MLVLTSCVSPRDAIREGPVCDQTADAELYIQMTDYRVVICQLGCETKGAWDLSSQPPFQVGADEARKIVKSSVTDSRRMWRFSRIDGELLETCHDG